MQGNIFYTLCLLQGLKRSVTTLRGGTLGYAEIVAVKVRHDFRPTGFIFCSALPLLLLVILVLHRLHHCVFS